MTTLVALLRAVNVGGRRMAMADLRAALAGAGFADARTLLQTGNVVVRTDLAPGAAARAMETAIADRFGFAVDVVVRTGPELSAIAATDPFAGAASDGARRVVVFYAEAPDPAPLDGLDFGPERFAAAGRELHLWCPDGQGRSPMLASRPMARLMAAGTARNSSTVSRLAAMAAEGVAGER